ncbi:MAG: SulP family inorganic anion transporter [Spirochaetaceae bacterium]|nr:SulP family inorganic anion transporter [Spirochaetaceae bacterium]
MKQQNNALFSLWISRPRHLKNDFLSGLTVSLALIPEAIAFAFILGIDPIIGLYAAFIMGLVTSLIGGASWYDFWCYRSGCSNISSLGQRKGCTGVLEFCFGVSFCRCSEDGTHSSTVRGT